MIQIQHHGPCAVLPKVRLTTYKSGSPAHKAVFDKLKVLWESSLFQKSPLWAGGSDCYLTDHQRPCPGRAGGGPSGGPKSATLATSKYFLARPPKSGTPGREQCSPK